MSILEDLLTKPGKDRSSYAPFWPEEIKTRSLKPIKQSNSTMTSTGWNLRFLALEDFDLLASEIEQLAASSIEKNLFLEPQFLQAGIQRIEDKGVMLACLWEGNPDAQKLRFMMPFITKKSGIPRHPIFQNFTHHFAPLGTPLLHADNALETVENLLRLLGDPELGIPTTIAINQQRMNGPTIEIIKQASTNLGLEFASVLTCQRAQLRAINHQVIDPQSHLKQLIGKKRFKEYARLLRRLNDKGKVTFEVSRKENDILDAIEGFLTLEARGWKGRSGTALYSLKEIAAFSRQAISTLAKIGRCEIHSMKLNGTIIAGLVCFNIDGEYYTWKIAFDEDYEAFSPGVQIMIHTSTKWLGQKHFKNADSLAPTNHKMIDHLWRDRLELGTLLIETGKHQPGKIEKIRSALERNENIRNLARLTLSRIKQIF